MLVLHPADTVSLIHQHPDLRVRRDEEGSRARLAVLSGAYEEGRSRAPDRVSASGIELAAVFDGAEPVGFLEARGYSEPAEKDDDVAAFARTRVNPAVATNPHSGECDYTEPEGKDGDVAAFARKRVIPGVATNPHSGECGYTDRLEAPGDYSPWPLWGRDKQRDIKTHALGYYADRLRCGGDRRGADGSWRGG